MKLGLPRGLAEGLLLRSHFGGFDQFPEFWVLLQRFILLRLQPGAKEEVRERMSIENAVDDQPEFMAFEINAVIAHPEPVERAAGTLELAELVHLRMHDLLGQAAKFTQNLQLQLFGHPRQFRSAGRVKDDLEGRHEFGFSVDLGYRATLKLAILWEGINHNTTS